MRTFVSLAAVAAVTAGLSFGATSAQADTYTFFNISNNGSPDISGQLEVEVESAGANQVSFKFTNNVGEASSITDIYFDDGTLLGIANIFESDGVEFSQGANPGHLPEGGDLDPPFVVTQDFLASSDAGKGGVMEHGVNASDEWVQIVFNLINGQTFADVIAALALDPNLPGSLRIGLKIQGFADEGSETYVNNPNPIPLPAGLILFLSGLAGVGFLGRLKAKRQETAGV